MTTFSTGVTSKWSFLQICVSLWDWVSWIFVSGIKRSHCPDVQRLLLIFLIWRQHVPVCVHSQSMVHTRLKNRIKYWCCDVWSTHEAILNCYLGYSTSAKCTSVWKPHRYLPDTPVNVISTSRSLHVLPGLPGAKLSAFRLCKSILRCSWKLPQLWRCIQDALIFDL